MSSISNTKSLNKSAAVLQPQSLKNSGVIISNTAITSLPIAKNQIQVNAAVASANNVNAAIQIVNTFNNQKNTKSLYKHVTKFLFCDALKDILRKPHIVNQEPFNLCGPATFTYYFAKNKPVDYAKASIDLFSKGKAKIGELDISANQDQFNYPFRYPYDQIFQTALRNGDSDDLNYSPAKDSIVEAWQGLTFPSTLMKWLVESKLAANAKMIEHSRNMSMDEFKSKHTGANTRANIVIAVIHPGLISDQWGIKVHYIAIISDLILSKDGKDVEFDYWTWPRKLPPKQTTHLLKASVEKFRRYYYGRIVAPISR